MLDQTHVMSLSHLDRWLPRPTIRTRHRRVSTVDADALWRTALGVRLSDTRALGRLIRWRIPGTAADQSFGELFRAYPFTILAEDTNLLVSGLCGRIWTLARDYPNLDGPAGFRDWHEAGTARVLFAHWTAPCPDGRTELISEARVQPVDRAAALRLRVLWKAVGPFDRLVGAEALTAAARRAEGSRARQTAPRAQGRRAARPRR
jgi:hypothetical protein